MSDLENQRAAAEARRVAAAHSDSPEHDELMLRYLGAELYAARSGPVAPGEQEAVPSAASDSPAADASSRAAPMPGRTPGETGLQTPAPKAPRRRPSAADNGDDKEAAVNEPRRIVVGVDGSDCSRSALKFALDEAVRRGAELRVIWAFAPPEYWATAYGMPAPPPLDELTDDIERAGRRMVDEIVSEGSEAAAHVPVIVQALLGSPGKVLVEQAQDADLMVIGHRGRGGFRSATLGSVGLYCVLHATVPVTVVRPIETSTPVTHPEAASATRQ